MLHTRPDVACHSNRAAQVSAKKSGKDKARELNQAITIVKENPTAGLHFMPLDSDSTHLRVYVDDSYATNDDLSWQLGYLIILCDDNNSCHFLDHLAINRGLS